MNKHLISLQYSDLFTYRELINLMEVYKSYENAWLKLASSRSLFDDQVREKKVKDFLNKNSVQEVVDNLLQENIYPLTIYDRDYPVLLKESKSPPLVIYTRGNKSLLQEDSISVVGTRKPTPYGRKIAFELSAYLADYLTIVSGLALGIDSEAHKGALKGSKKTIAVLGSGFHYPYPPENKELFNNIIAEGGLILTEYPPYIKPDSWRFPARNRIIAGISKGTVVIEAGIKSGALITANYAMEEGREVFAVPGLITNTNSQGSNRLLKDGAHLVQKYSDILEALAVFHNFKLGSTDKVISDGQGLIGFLDGGPLSAEELAEMVSEPIESILFKLSLLELEGKVARKSGIFHKV
ncbi:MAG: DNA processing protein DprA [candidate division WS2 bacterium]|nr:DNA processing protein DprA [Candidatus Lithacetigena glycinireducens]MBT9174612.1 DNA processing protein DprA [Candidatus Lithacetigena glycinireducens]